MFDGSTAGWTDTEQNDGDNMGWKTEMLTLFDIALHLDGLNQICVFPLYTRTLLDPTIPQQNCQCCYEHSQRVEAARIE